MNRSYNEELIFTISAYLNVYLVSFLLVFGSIFNSFYLIVIILARRRSPRIGGKKYLIILTISSFFYLNLHFFIHTLPYIYYLVESNDQTELVNVNFIDSNRYICKVFVYLRLVSRCSFTMATLGYSLERALAIYFPFKIMIYKDKVSKFIFIVTVLVSLAAPFFVLFFYDIYNNRCEIDKQQWDLYRLSLFYLNLTTSFLPFITIVTLNASILIKLKKYEIIVTTLCTKSTKTNVKSEILKILNNIYEENFSLIQEKLLPINQKLKFRKAFELKSSTRMSCKSNSDRKENNKYSILSKLTAEKSKSANIVTSAVLTSDYNFSKKLEKKRQSFYVNQQFPNTNFFIIISSINMFLNIPFIVNTCFIFNPYLKENFGDVEALSTRNAYLFLYLTLTELITTAKYSLTIFFFTFSNVFRYHLNDISKRHSTYILRK